MAKNESTQSKAEIYRAERKERIAKANKKNAKGNSVASKVVPKIVAVVIAVAVVALAAWYLTSTLGLVEKTTTALKVGDTKISTMLYNYYYKAEYQQASYYASYYQQYGMDSGFNASLPLDDPANTTQDKDGNVITWAEAFKESASNRAQFVESYYAEALNAKLSLTDDEKAEIDETIESYRSSAAENNYSLNAYLKAVFGAGFNEKVLRKQLEKEKLAENFYNSKQTEFTDAVTAEQISTEYKANPFKYDYADVRYYSIPFASLTKTEGEADDAFEARKKAENAKITAQAEAILAKITDSASFITAATEKANEGKTGDEVIKDDPTTLSKHATYDSLSTSFTEDGAKWIFEAARKAGDKKVIEGAGAAYIVFIEKPAYTSCSVDVRHIFVNFNAAGNTATDEEKAAAKTKAEEIYNSWKSGEMTDATFAALATEKTEDTGSTETGGLYEGVRVSDNMYPQFLDWCFADGRKVGDHGLVESDTGYHIMYMKQINTADTDRDNTIRTNLSTDSFQKFSDDLLAEGGEYAIEENSKWIGYAVNKFCADIRRNLAYSAK